jgi:hypothetical protein
MEVRLVSPGGLGRAGDDGVIPFKLTKMEWSNFIDRIYEELRDGVAFHDFRHAIVTEQDLTEVTALGLRDIFTNFFGILPQSDLTLKHVTFTEAAPA